MNTLWATALVDELARAGVRELVVAPGSRSTPIVLAAARDDRLRARVHLDERSAGFFALGVGKATGRPAAVVTTSGTAVANLLPAVVEASQAGVPLLVLSADRPPRLRGADANQAIEQPGIFGPYVRESFDPGLPVLDEAPLRHLRTVAARAVASALAPRAGPVHVNLPFDKPLEPAPTPDGFLRDHPLAAHGRPERAPFATVATGRPRASEEQIDELAEWCAPERVPIRGVLVAGPTEEAERTGPAVLALAVALGWPILADPLSGARFAPARGALRVSGYDLFLGDPDVGERLAPDLVLRIGASPTSASVQKWLLHHGGVRHVVIDPTDRWKDHAAVATHYLRADPAEALGQLVERVVSGPADGEWIELWRAADEAARRVIADTGAGEAEAHEGRVVADVVDALPSDASLVVSNSMPIRDVDAFVAPSDRELRVYGNRGASGIDGVVSTAFGIASQSEHPTVCILGDVAFFHDRNGLLWSREPDASVVFVLVDNDGGGIFHSLPIANHEPAFTRFFATPHGVDPRPVVEGHGIEYDEVAPSAIGARVDAALASGHSTVLRVRTDRDANHRLHLASRDSAVRSVAEALG